MQEEDNVLRILKETKDALKENDSSRLKSLSNQTTNTASLTQDPDNIAVAVMVYSIGKILERDNYKSLRGWDAFYRIIISSLDRAIKDLTNGDIPGFRKDFEMIRKAINKVSGRLRKDIEDVFRKAQINKASRIYAHGISLAQTAKLLGITMYELADYAGRTGISDAPVAKTMDTKTRIKLAMDMFE